MMKGQKGITLVALVITIIVMLILVAVTVTIAINGGLFGAAKDAATQTNEKQKAENDLGSGIVNIDNQLYNATDYAQNDKPTPITPTD